MSTKRRDYVGKIQQLIHCDRGMTDVVIKYGYMESGGKFVESEVDVNMDEDKYECVLVKYETQSDQFGVIQSIEADGFFWILTDTIKAISKL